MAINTIMNNKNISMNKLTRFFIIFITCLFPFGYTQAAPQIQHWTTDNGARVYFFPAPELPMVDIQITFDAGSVRDGKNGGVAQLTSKLFDDGAGSLNADQIAERFEGLGANFGASAHHDTASISLRSLTDPKLLQPALETLQLILQSPTFPEDSLERERKRSLIALKAQQQSPGRIASNEFYAAVYGDHPYAANPIGTEASLQALTRQDILKHYQDYYVASNAVVAIVGALDRKAAEAMVSKLLAELPEGTPAPAIAEVTALTEGRMIEIDHPSSQTHVLVGHPGISRDDPDYFTLYVGNHILGGSGLVSRISEEVREKRGLSYSAYSYFSPMRDKGPYTLGLQTSNEQTAEALQVLMDTLQRYIDEGPTKEELKASKQNITGGFPLRISSNSKILGYLAVIGFYKLPLDYLDTFIQNVEAVTVDQIRDAYRRRVHPDKMITVTVGSQTTEK